MKKTKRFGAAKQLIEKGKAYDVNEAMALVKQTATAKFDETIEISVRLGVDPATCRPDGPRRCSVAQRNRQNPESAGICKGRQGNRSRKSWSRLCRRRRNG